MWHLKPFQSLHCFLQSSQKCLSRFDDIQLIIFIRRQSMNNDIFDYQTSKTKSQLRMEAEEINKLMSDPKRLNERVEELNRKAVICISEERWEQALVYLESAEQLLQSAALKGFRTNRCLVQCVLHNQANCFQNLWQLNECSNYIEALIFNLNSRKQQQLLSPPGTINKLALAQYYLQFCAVNSQLNNHSGALISARKSLNLIRRQIIQWKNAIQLNRKQKGDRQQKIRLLQLVCKLNDNLNLNILENLQEAVSYYIQSWKSNLSNRKLQKQLKQLIQNFTIKSVMTLPKFNYLECIKRFEKQCEKSMAEIYYRILMLSVCYFTIGTELRMIAVDRSEQDYSDKTKQPQFKQSQIYHLLSILLLSLTLPINSLFVNQLISNYQNHYNKDFLSQQLQFKKIFAEIIFVESQREKDISLQCSEEDAIASLLSKGSGTNIKIIKTSKQLKSQNKGSGIDKKQKKSKQKISRNNSKTKKEILFSNKNKNAGQHSSKSPNFKSVSKDSAIIKSQKSKSSLHKQPISQTSIIPSIPSIKLISNKSKPLLQRQKSNQKPKSKIKRSNKLQQNGNQYFLIKKGEKKKKKKSSLSSKKHNSQPRSTGRLPIDSTLETKDNAGKQKKNKKTILQHYL